MDLAQRDWLLENLQKKSAEINSEMEQLGRIIAQKGGNKFMASVQKQYDHYIREQVGGKRETLAVMHSIVDYLDTQIASAEHPQLQTRAMGGRRRVLSQIAKYNGEDSDMARQNIKK